ncbi:hypothetical protein WMY93_029888 [Mugilogobius chulae]|uniref:Uncharacterized protein n=1 Tax=Mugilogobius chulae TaxID=88201 RepID=A0AAW0MX55_9GOBI
MGEEGKCVEVEQQAEEINMTKPKSGHRCPICSKFLNNVSQHLRNIHRVKQAEERKILNDLASGFTVIPPGLCPVEGCNSKINYVAKHLRRHKDIPKSKIEELLESARREAAVKLLSDLRSSNPSPPMVSRLHTTSQPCDDPGCLQREEELNCLMQRVRQLEKENSDLRLRISLQTSRAGPQMTKVPSPTSDSKPSTKEEEEKEEEKEQEEGGEEKEEEKEQEEEEQEQEESQEEEEQEEEEQEEKEQEQEKESQEEVTEEEESQEEVTEEGQDEKKKGEEMVEENNQMDESEDQEQQEDQIQMFTYLGLCSQRNQTGQSDQSEDNDKPKGSDPNLACTETRTDQPFQKEYIIFLSERNR